MENNSLVRPLVGEPGCKLKKIGEESFLLIEGFKES